MANLVPHDFSSWMRSIEKRLNMQERRGGPSGPRQVIRDSTPTEGTWGVGDIVWYRTPVAGGFIGEVCIQAGEPGVWTTWGPIT